MHPDQVVVDAALVRSLLRRRLPEYAQLPLRPVASGGTVNAVFRLGDAFSVRLPLTADGVSSLLTEARWLPRLAPLLPLPVPAVVLVGEPSDGFPFPWAVHRWLDGAPLAEGPDHLEHVARDLAAFVVAFRGVPLANGPAAHRAGRLAEVDNEIRAGLEALRGLETIDADAVLRVWEHSAATPYDPTQQSWIHSDLMPSNLLAATGRLVGVLDFGTVGLGDPAVDLVPAWNLFTPATRRIFRDHVEVDDDMWERGRGWAVAMAAVQLPYYRGTNRTVADNARWVLTQVSTD